MLIQTTKEPMFVPKNKILGILFFLMLMGCNSNKVVPIAPTDAVITFAVKWDNINQNITAPTSLTVWLYPRTDGAAEAQTIEIPANKTVDLKLKEGVYDVIAYNKSSLNTMQIFETDAFMTHMGILPFLEVETNDQNIGVVDQTDHLHALVGSTGRVIEIKPDKSLLVTFYPKTITKTYHVNINVKSNVDISGGMANLVGVKRKVMFGSGALLSEGVASVNFPMLPMAKSEGSFQGSANILGVETRSEGSLVKNILNVKLDYVDPVRDPLELDFDITSQVDNNPNVNLDINVEVDITKDKPLISITVKPYDVVQGGDIIIDPL